MISHDQREIPAVLVNNLRPEEMNLLVAAQPIMIDEANFFDDELLVVVRQFLREGRDVYVAGLTHDSERAVWGPMTDLVEMADTKIVVTAKCDGLSGKCKKYNLVVSQNSQN